MAKPDQPPYGRHIWQMTATPSRLRSGMVALAEIPALPTPHVPAPSSVVPALATLVAERDAGDGGGLFQRDPACSGKQGGVRIGAYVNEVVAYRQTVGGVVSTYYPHYNYLYSVAALTDSTGVVVELFQYTAYGKQIITDASMNVTRTKSAVGFDRGFTGYIIDHESSLLHARARPYSPTLGRFVGRDFKIENYRAPVVTWIEDGLTPSGIRNLGMSLAIPEEIAQHISEYFWGPALPLTLYSDGYGLYSAYFSPNSLDPTGHEDESGEEESCPVDPTLYCVYTIQMFPSNETLGGQKSEGMGNEIKICISMR